MRYRLWRFNDTDGKSEDHVCGESAVTLALRLLIPQTSRNIYYTAIALAFYHLGMAYQFQLSLQLYVISFPRDMVQMR